MYATSIENKPKTYARPTLIGTNFMNIVASEPSEDPPSEDESELIIEYKFDTTPASDAVAGYQNPNMVSVSDNEGSTRYNYSLLRFISPIKYDKPCFKYNLLLV